MAQEPLGLLFILALLVGRDERLAIRISGLVSGVSHYLTILADHAKVGDILEPNLVWRLPVSVHDIDEFVLIREGFHRRRRFAIFNVDQEELQFVGLVLGIPINSRSFPVTRGSPRGVEVDHDCGVAAPFAEFLLLPYPIDLYLEGEVRHILAYDRHGRKGPLGSA